MFLIDIHRVNVNTLGSNHLIFICGQRSFQFLDIFTRNLQDCRQRTFQVLDIFHGICKIPGKEHFKSLIFLHGICKIAGKEHFKSLIFLHRIWKIAGKESFKSLIFCSENLQGLLFLDLQYSHVLSPLFRFVNRWYSQVPSPLRLVILSCGQLYLYNFICG